MHRRSRDVVLGAGSSCFKYAALQTKTCNMDECPGKCFWWEFMGGKVLKGIPPGREDCFDDIKLLPLKAQKYVVGMGNEYIEMINPVKSVCGACILFTSLGGKVGISFIYRGVNRISYLLFRYTYVLRNTVKFLNRDFIKAVQGGEEVTVF